jgi:hypothetical protein
MIPPHLSHTHISLETSLLLLLFLQLFILQQGIAPSSTLLVHERFVTRCQYFKDLAASTTLLVGTIDGSSRMMPQAEALVGVPTFLGRAIVTDLQDSVRINNHGSCTRANRRIVNSLHGTTAVCMVSLQLSLL